jgi:hypothetical protein
VSDSCYSKLSRSTKFTFGIADLAEIAWERGTNGFNTNTLAYKLRMNERDSGLTRHQQAYICGIVLEGGSDIVRSYSCSSTVIVIVDLL